MSAYNKKRIMIRVCNLRYSTPRDKMVCLTNDWGNTWEYFSSNYYGSIFKAKQHAREFLEKQENEYRKQF